jgi:Family of unknown function (DUF6186)
VDPEHVSPAAPPGMRSRSSKRERADQAGVPQDCLPVRSGVLRRNQLVVVLVGALIGAYSWFSADLRPFTIPIGAVVAIPSVVVASLTWSQSGSRTTMTADEKALRRLDAAPWAVVFGLLTAFEVAAYLSSPRRDHPTLSSMADALMNTHPGRAAVFAFWLLLGWALFLRRASA